ncbi:MAG: hypothetical protein CMO64_02335 [Verrucomicrobiales bacterium]|nr:hypothetical protein [Verrucomicrobiales bacterium]
MSLWTNTFALLLALNAGAAPLSLKDVRGRPVQPMEAATKKAAILFFITTDCPIANKFAPQIQKLAARYAPHARCTLVYPDPDLTGAAIQKHLVDFGYGKLTAVHDHDHRLVLATGAEVTPEAVVVDARGRIVYRGRINNYYADFGKPRRVITVHDLRDALDAVIAGKPVARPRTEAIGCYITPLKSR